MTSRTTGVRLTLLAQGAAAAGSASTMVLLARSLSVEDRGIVAAVMAPTLLIIAVCPGALVDPVTYFVARNPRALRSILSKCVLIGSCLTGVGVVMAALLSPLLLDGNVNAQRLVVTISCTSFIGCGLVLVRAAANAQRKWKLLALDSLISNLGKLLVLVGLSAAGFLNLTTAAWTLALVGFAGLVVYVPRSWRSRMTSRYTLVSEDQADGDTLTGLASGLSSSARDSELSENPSYARIAFFTSGSWIGVLSASSLAFFDQVLMTPLAGAEQLAFYAVAMGVANLVGLPSVSIRSVVYATESANIDWHRVAEASRVSLALTAGLGATVAIAAPVVLPALFGHAYRAAVVPLLILLVGTTVLGAGTIATAGLSAAGKPHLRACAVLSGALCNGVLVLALVPRWGATGAAVAMLANIPLTAVALVLARPIHKLSPWEFVRPRRRDFELLCRTLRPGIFRLTHR